MQAEREAAGKAAAAAGEEVARLKGKLQEAAEETEEALRRHLADQQRVQVCEQKLLLSSHANPKPETLDKWPGMIDLFIERRHEVHAASQSMHHTCTLSSTRKQAASPASQDTVMARLGCGCGCPDTTVLDLAGCSGGLTLECVPVQAAHELEAASLRGAIAAAQETAEELRAQAEEQALLASAAQEALQERLAQMQADAASLEAAKGVSSPQPFCNGLCVILNIQRYVSSSLEVTRPSPKPCRPAPIAMIPQGTC